MDSAQDRQTVRTDTKKCTNECWKLKIEIKTGEEATRVAWKREKWKEERENAASCSWFLSRGVECHFYEEKARKPERWTVPTSRQPGAHKHSGGSMACKVWWRSVMCAWANQSRNILINANAENISINFICVCFDSGISKLLVHSSWRVTFKHNLKTAKRVHSLSNTPAHCY